jgi:hypothetical protein
VPNRIGPGHIGGTTRELHLLAIDLLGAKQEAIEQALIEPKAKEMRETWSVSHIEYFPRVAVNARIPR